ncbi:MAG: CRISPR-associated endonuclease Cas1 [Deltaproteobacteria bacterium CG_4_8_14_3_um_filter_45_9]|nr:MAG: CRISPR-associated endonuclease Cas1 [Deltaproteobacteria bacterium CG_4_8_14_3_um_filter_45_9]
MSIVYLMEQNATVSKEGGRLLIKKEGAVSHSIHLFKLEQIVLFGNIFLTPAAIRYLLKEGIDTAFMTRQGRYLGRLQSALGKNIVLRREQFRKMEDDGFCLKTAKAVIKGKLSNLRTVLMRLNRQRENLELDNEILSLRNLIPKVDEAGSLDTLRGYEGKGSAVYFEGFSKGFLAEDFKFPGRVRRPPTDPINALLSLGYTLLMNQVIAAVGLIGFDPYFGSLHSVDYGRPSLALDLMEEWRPIIVDTLVLSVFNLKALTPSDFEERKPVLAETGSMREEELAESSESAGEGKSAILLTEAGFRKFIAQYERKMGQKVQYHLTGDQISYRDCIREQVRHFARYLKGEEIEYQPMPLR